MNTIHIHHSGPHLVTLAARLQGLPPEAAGGAPVLRLLDLPGEGDLLICEPPDGDVGAAHGGVGGDVGSLAARGAVPDLSISVISIFVMVLILSCRRSIYIDSFNSPSN